MVKRKSSKTNKTGKTGKTNRTNKGKKRKKEKQLITGLDNKQIPILLINVMLIALWAYVAFWHSLGIRDMYMMLMIALLMLEVIILWEPNNDNGKKKK